MRRDGMRGARKDCSDARPGGGLARKDWKGGGLRKDGEKFSANEGKTEHTGVGLKTRQGSPSSPFEKKAETQSGSGDEDAPHGDSAPPGMEHVVKALKNKPEIDNPYAVAWSMADKD